MNREINVRLTDCHAKDIDNTDKMADITDKLTVWTDKMAVKKVWHGFCMHGGIIGGLDNEGDDKVEYDNNRGAPHSTTFRGKLKEDCLRQKNGWLDNGYLCNIT